jgi:hypothetical protein
MSTRDDFFPSKWFKASDIPDAGMPVKIDHVTRERVGTEQELKPIVHFANQTKALVLNVSNFDCIEAALNEADTNRWAGKVVELFATETRFGGKTMPCVRVRKYRKPAVAAPEPVSEANPPPADDFADELNI